MGMLGLLLVALIGWASERRSRRDRTRFDAAAALIAIGFVTVIGWTVDRLARAADVVAGRGAPATTGWATEPLHSRNREV